MEIIKSLNKEIARTKPKRRSALANVLIKRLFGKGSFKINVLNVYFMGCYQGVKVEIKDLENNEVFELPNKEDVYSLTKGNEIEITIQNERVHHFSTDRLNTAF